jgi:environmental stress-induced protein Ves
VRSPELTIIRRASFTATPWKNGGGITYEAIRVPAVGDPFRWRVSVAHIDASGPFSEFAAHDRKMVLLQGAGVELRFADGATQTLREVGQLIQFDGAVAAQCELLDGPCIDLNLMILKSDRAAVRVERVSESVAVSAPPSETTLVFPIDGAITLEANERQIVTLLPWDLAILSNGSGCLRKLEPHLSAQSIPPANPPATAVFVATLVLMSGEQEAGLGV